MEIALLRGPPDDGAVVDGGVEQVVEACDVGEGVGGGRGRLRTDRRTGSSERLSVRRMVRFAGAARARQQGGAGAMRSAERGEGRLMTRGEAARMIGSSRRGNEQHRGAASAEGAACAQ